MKIYRFTNDSNDSNDSETETIDPIDDTQEIQDIEGLDITKHKNQSIKEHTQQQRELKNYIKILPGLVEQIYSNGKTIYDQITQQLPGRNIGSLLRQRRKQWMLKANEIQGLQEFYSYVAGEDNKQKVLRLLCDMVSGQMLLRDGKKRLINWASNFFKNTATEEKQSQSFEGSGYDPQFIDFFPPQVYFDLGPNRQLLEIKESFGRQQKNWEIMSKKVAYIAQHFNAMLKDIKNDLTSGNHTTKLLALMMGITIETGLRPGKIGNQVTKINKETGEKTIEDTFGVSTLQVNHIKNIRDGFAELQFPGKKGTLQIAKLSDAQIVQTLQAILATTSLQGDSAMLFIDKSGQPITDAHLRKYVSDKWQDITPTDFRKYVATRTFYNNVKQATESFRLKLIDEIDKDQEELKNTVINGIINVVNESLASTKEILNHKDGHEAWQTYVSPKVILAFIANGGFNATLEEILIDNKTVRFTFDFKEFLKFADNL